MKASLNKYVFHTDLKCISDLKVRNCIILEHNTKKHIHNTILYCDCLIEASNDSKTVDKKLGDREKSVCINHLKCHISIV